MQDGCIISKGDIMRIVIQRVTHASVTVDEKVCGEINKGFLLLVGVSDTDDEAICEKLADKISKLRIFEDENEKINLSISDIGGEMLIISQFTLYADCRKGNRPSFTNAGSPEKAEKLYEHFISVMKSKNIPVERGIFGADMNVSLLNDGPFTVVLDSDLM